MCDFIIWGKEEIHTIGELKRKIPSFPLVLRHYLYKLHSQLELSDADCLCPVDLEKTFAQANISAVYLTDYKINGGYWKVKAIGG